MLEIVYGGIFYAATLIGCYDGDTCTVDVHTPVPFVNIQHVRFIGFDTPEKRGKCLAEKKLAKQAAAYTLYQLRKGAVLHTDGERGKYGRLLVTSPAIAEGLIKRGLARAYTGGGRLSWCNTAPEVQ